jgi:4a-hydroxytetrahydrobiopterin dehydratase
MAHERRALNDAEVSEALATLPGWRREGDALARTFEFGTYKDGVVFAAAVGFLADRLDHHPDLTLGYRKVEVRLSTHDVGGISGLDAELARRIDTLLN